MPHPPLPALLAFSRFRPHPHRKARPSPRFGRFSPALALAIGVAAAAMPRPAHAQKTPASGNQMGRASSQNALPARGANYLLGPGDVLALTVAGYPEYNQPSIAVPPDGLISVPTFGTLRVSGRTALAVQNELRALLIQKVRMRNPQLALSITTFRPPAPKFVGRVILAGDVPKPGSFDIRSRERLSDLLAEAGVNERLEEKSAILVRGDQTLPLDLFAAAKRPGSPRDVRLKPGDSLTVRALSVGIVTIADGVARPGTYELHAAPRGERELGAAPRLSDLLIKSGFEAGGAANAEGGNRKAENGAPTLAGSEVPPSGFPVPRSDVGWTGVLQRGGKRLPIHPDAALSRIGGGDDIPLRAGDFVTVSPIPPIKVSVDGLVSHPNLYLLAPDTKVLQLLIQAGGLTQAPGEIVASVRRGNQTIPLDLPALFSSSDGSANASLQDGDFVQLRAPETLEVQVTGQVTKPGPTQVRPGATILDALTKAGGVLSSLPVEDVQLRLLRKETDGSQRIINADAVGILRLTDATTNAVLQAGDFISVAKSGENTVYINGEVTTPGSFTLREGEGITQLITRAGGPKDTAALSKITVNRAGKVLPVDAYDAVRKNAPLNFPLEQGDQVIVPKNQNLVLVTDGVSKPGFIPIPEHGSLTLIDVIGIAAPLPGANKVFVVHALPDGTFDTKNAKQIKIDDLKRGRTPNLTLQPHDVVSVQAPHQRSSILNSISQLGALSLFF